MNYLKEQSKKSLHNRSIAELIMNNSDEHVFYFENHSEKLIKEFR